MTKHTLKKKVKRLNLAGHYIDAENKKDYFTEWVLKVNKTPRPCIIVILQGVLFNTLSCMIKIFTKIVFFFIRAVANSQTESPTYYGFALVKYFDHTLSEMFTFLTFRKKS